MRIWMRILTIDSTPRSIIHIYYIYRSCDLVILAWTNCCWDQQRPQFVLCMPHMMGPDGFVCYHELDHNPGGNSLQDKKKNVVRYGFVCQVFLAARVSCKCFISFRQKKVHERYERWWAKRLSLRKVQRNGVDFILRGRQNCTVHWSRCLWWKDANKCLLTTLS